MKMSEAANELYRHRRNFIIIGLTGRTGSGCSTVANAMASELDQLNFTDPAESDSDHYEDKKKRIIQEYISKNDNWQPFYTIHVRDIISTFILECKYEEINGYLTSLDMNFDLKELKEEIDQYRNKSECLNEIYADNHDDADEDEVYHFLTVDLPKFTDKFKEFVDSKSNNSFIKIYQRIGDNIRKHGDAVEKKKYWHNMFFLCLTE